MASGGGRGGWLRLDRANRVRQGRHLAGEDGHPFLEPLAEEPRERRRLLRGQAVGDADVLGDVPLAIGERLAQSGDGLAAGGVDVVDRDQLAGLPAILQTLELKFDLVTL